jgi:predicted MPP superfamily phosphohydrolase
LYLIQSTLPIDKSKRAFFKRISDIGFLTLGVGYAGAGIIGGAKEPIIVEVEVKQNRFAKPYKIAQISDMHINGLIDRDFVKNSVEMINAQNPDIVVITGDLVDTKIENIKDAVDELKNLKSRLGTLYIVGNHEDFHNIQNTIDYIKTINITVLEITSVKIENFYIVGVYDTFGYRYEAYIPDIKKATQNIPKDKATLLLAHQPKFVEYLEEFKPSLMLSGHTHGGQVKPLDYLVKLQQPYLKGLYNLGKNRHIYVNSGIGFWGPPMRLGTTAEITMIYWS